MTALLRRCLAATWIALAAGCSTYDASQHYDAAALEQPAKVIGKRKFATRAQPAADSKTLHTVVPIAGAAGLVFVPLSIGRSSEAVIDIYEYTVETAGQERLLVYNDFASFEIGHCVTLFTSSRPGYPRISPVGRCP
jgi:hypothetical protein